LTLEMMDPTVSMKPPNELHWARSPASGIDVRGRLKTDEHWEKFSGYGTKRSDALDSPRQPRTPG